MSDISVTKPSELTFEMFQHDFQVMNGKRRDENIRAGQLAFNMLLQIRPEMAEGLRASELDPFMLDDRLPAFFEHLEAHWSDGSPS